MLANVTGNAVVDVIMWMIIIMIAIPKIKA
jgi:hypothetical protein